MTPSPAKRPSTSGKVMLAVLGAGVIILGLAIFIFFGRSVIQASRASDWVSHPCTIDSTVIEVSRSSGSRGRSRETRNLRAAYSWEWEGETYHSDRFSFTSDTVESSEDEARNIRVSVRRPNGFRCWVNPHNPREAVLSRDVPWVVMTLLIPFAALFPVVGVAFMFSGGSARERREAQAVASWPEEPLQWREDWSQGRIEEKSLWHSPGTRLAAAWVIFVLAAAFAGLFVTTSWTGGRQLAVLIMGALLVAAVVATSIRAWSAGRFGRLEFVPDALPMHPGLPLSGHVPLRNPLRRTRGMKARIQVTRTIYKGRSARTEKVASVKIGLQVEPQAIFLSTVLPEAPPFFPVDPGGSVAWTLTLKAPGRGINATFELPVQAYY